MKILRRYWLEISLTAIILCGTILRLSRFWQSCLVTEELDTIGMMSWPLSELLFNTSLGSPALYFLFAKLCTVMTGSLEEWVLRFPALLFGILEIPAMYVLGKEYAGKISGIMCAFFAAFTYSYIWYSDYCRPYTLILLLFTLSGIIYIRIIRDEEKQNKTNILWFSLITVLCLWSHFYSIIPLSLAWIILLIKDYARLKYVVLFIIPGIPITILYFLNILKNFSGISQYSLSTFKPSWIELLITIPFELFGYACIILIPVFVYAITVQRQKSTILLSVISVGTVIITLVATTIFNPVSRYVLLVSPWIAVVAIGSISDLIERRSKGNKKAIWVCLILYGILALNLFPLTSLYSLNYCEFAW